MAKSTALNRRRDDLPITAVDGAPREWLPDATLSWRLWTPGSTSTIADGVAGRFPIPEVLDDLLLIADDAVLVAEQSIITGIRLLHNHAGLIVEPSAA